MTGPFTSAQFNFLEGCFCLFLAALVVVAYFRAAALYRNLLLFAAVGLFLFGVSDFMQVLYGSFFEPGLWWLYVWKVVNLLWLVVVLPWYVVLRIRNTNQ